MPTKRALDEYDAKRDFASTPEPASRRERRQAPPTRHQSASRDGVAR
jgi:hypothetical protein